MEKTCVICKKVFTCNSNSQKTCSNFCKEVLYKESKKKYYAENKEKIINSRKEKYNLLSAKKKRELIEKVKKYMKKYRKCVEGCSVKNKEKIRSYNRSYYLKNKEEILRKRKERKLKLLQVSYDTKKN